MKQQAHHKRRNTYDPQALLAALCRVAPSFSGNQQHDAHEALHALLEGLQVRHCAFAAYVSSAPHAYFAVHAGRIPYCRDFLVERKLSRICRRRKVFDRDR